MLHNNVKFALQIGAKLSKNIFDNLLVKISDFFAVKVITLLVTIIVAKFSKEKTEYSVNKIFDYLAIEVIALYLLNNSVKYLNNCITDLSTN